MTISCIYVLYAITKDGSMKRLREKRKNENVTCTGRYGATNESERERERKDDQKQSEHL